MRISDLLTKERITLDIKATEKNEVIRELARIHEATGVLRDYEGYVEALMEREAQSSTGLEDGIAIPHAKTEFVKEPALVMGVSEKGVDFDAMDGQKSNLFFMIAAPEGANNTHIETLKRLTQMLLDDSFKEKLEKAKSAEEVIALINANEEEQLNRENSEEKTVSAENKERPFIVAATACPTGIAHTYMAEGALKIAAEEMGVDIKVETNGADGRKNILTADEINRAVGVILAVNRNVDEDRFDGKPMVKVSAQEGINNAKKLIQRVLDGECEVHRAENKTVSQTSATTGGSNLYKHLMSGVSYMLPLVISGGILIALAFLADTLTGNGNAGAGYGSTSQIAKYFNMIGGEAFGLFVAILGGFIAYSIGDRTALAAGLVAGALAKSGGSGFLGAMAGGFLAGYVTKYLVKSLTNLPKSLDGLKIILIYPVASVFITGLTMILLLNPVVGVINEALNGWLLTLQGGSALFLGALLGGMMSVDMGGPVNKAAYVFGTGTLAASISTGGSGAMAAVMAGGMVPPLAIAIATSLFKNKFTEDERKAGVSNYIMGLSFITEGAIPYAAADPTRVIPSCVIGSAVAGLLTMMFGIKIPAPHGGILVMFLSNNFIMYFLSILVGSVVGAILLGLLKKEIKSKL